METVVIIIFALSALSFLLKLSFHGWPGRVGLALLCALFTALATDAASMQSKTQIADWLGRPELMLDAAVWLTLDVALQIAFCVVAAGPQPHTRGARIGRAVLLWFPGLIIFPALFALLTAAMFALTGTDFALIGRTMAACVLFLFPAGAWAMKWLLPERELRLELLFLLALLTAALGIVATVNGRTAAVGTGSVELLPLLGVFALILVGAAAGMLLARMRRRRLISKSHFK